MAMFAFAMLASGCSTPPNKPEHPVRGDYGYVERYLNWLIPGEMRRAQVHGLSIALVDDQRVVWSQSFGYADAERGIPATDRTVYGIGSVTKLFTATAIMQLAEQGQIDLDAPVNRYLPEFSVRARFPQSAPITVRSLLTHHSGLPGDRLKGMWTLRPVPFAQALDLLKDEYASYPPNLVYSYSNLGYSLLGCVIERVSGRAYAAVMHDALLAPLGMADSALAVDPGRQQPLAVGYRHGRPGAERYYLRDTPAGALFSSAADMTRFVRVLFADGQAGSHSILRSDSLREMWRAQNSDVALDMDFRVGLGWMLGQPGLNHAGPVVHHSGGTLGAASELMLLPRHKLGVIVLVNSPTGSAMIKRVAVQTLTLALEAKTGLQAPPPKRAGQAPATDPAGAVPPAGNYATSFGVVIPVQSRGTYLKARFQGRTFALLPRADGQLAVQYRLFGWLPIPIPELEQVTLSGQQIAGRNTIAIRHDGRRFLAGMHIAPRPIPQAWLQRVGRYVIANQGEDGTLIENLALIHEHSVLLLKYTLPEAPGFTPSIALEPVSDDEAISAGLGRFMGETFRAITVAGEERVLYSGYQLRRVTGAGANR